MNLDEYEWSRNPRGMHSAINYLDVAQLQRSGMGWAKIVALGDGEIGLAQSAQDRGMTPIVRIYRERPGNAPVDGLALQQFERFRQNGVRWFEYWNEPNLDIEWPRGVDFNPNNPGVVGPLMDNWLNWAEFIIGLDAYPAFPSLADVNDGTRLDTITWIRRMMEYLYDNHFERFRSVLDNGAYIAVHPYIYNHFYQRLPGGDPLQVRPPSLQRAEEGGWHFEYPYDAINQADDPGVTVWGGTERAPYGDTVGLLGSATAIMEQLQTLFGVEAVPFVGTEGGITPPTSGNLAQPDRRYPPITFASHAEATVAMFEWIATTAPPWFFGVALWKFDEYYQTAEGSLPAVERLAQRPPLLKAVPPLPALGGPGRFAENTPVTPAEPDYHFVFMAPGFDPDWFFSAAQNYCDFFKPSVLSTLDYLERLEQDKSIAVTAITRSDMVDWLAANIVQRWPWMRLDTVVVQNPVELAQVLDQRVVLGRRLG
jgi:hypothetical protein